MLDQCQITKFRSFEKTIEYLNHLKLIKVIYKFNLKNYIIIGTYEKYGLYIIGIHF